jgi:hypothetical protein
MFIALSLRNHTHLVGTVNIGTKRVFSLGVPLAIVPDSAALSMGLPNPTPLIFVPAGQMRVVAQ